MLEVEGLDVAYGAIQALRGLSLHVEQGEMVALLGANGAGKTTTLRTVSGLLTPRGGSITFEGQRIDGVPAYKLVNRGVAHLPEGRDLFPSLTVEENLKYGHWTRRRDKGDYKRQLDKVMDHFPRLRERRSQVARTLSGGEQQMLGVARALMSSPKLLLIDELSLGLAPMIVRQLFEILDGVNQEGTAVLLVEQFVHMALAHTDRAYVLYKGEVVLEGNSKEMADNPNLIASYLGDAEAGVAADPEPVAPRRRKRAVESR
ncbi:MAG TPA: ABC transporter ATP-binding protein [Acidimicrobiales bacterium]|nr:ABC transporter ATP-binding protein [Acidimicrobiales bacterium]